MARYKTIAEESLEVFKDELIINFEFNNQDIRSEMKILDKCNSEDDYIRASRIGLKSIGNRTARKELYSLYTLWVRG